MNDLPVIEQINEEMIKKFNLRKVSDLSIGNYKIIMIIAEEQNQLKIQSIFNAEVIEITKDEILKSDALPRRQILLKVKVKIIRDQNNCKDYDNNTLIWKYFGFTSNLQ